MPVDRSRYPADWDAISSRIRFERAGNRCEQCGAPNGKEIVRSMVDPARFIVFDANDCAYTTPDGHAIRLSEIPEEFDIAHGVRVVLTVHHIGVPKPDGSAGDPHDKLDCRDENLVALCQRCHLRADMPSHVANAKATRALKKQREAQRAGQLPLFE